MEKLIDSQKVETDGIVSSYQLLTLYFPAFILALGYSIATPAIPIFAKSFDTGFGVASLVIVVHALGGLIAAVPTGFLVDHCRPPADALCRSDADGSLILSYGSGSKLSRASLLSLSWRRGDGNVAASPARDHCRCQ